MILRIECPYCESIVEVEKSWVQQNGRVFCGTCCKAFDTTVPEEKEDYNIGDFWD